MGTRDQFALRFGPGLLPGITFLHWMHLLVANRFAISPRHLMRSASTTYCSLMNSFLRIFELIRFDRAIRDAEVAAPIFVLGHWRNGTTHLHNLLSVDDRFACPNLYQVLYPHTFLTTESTWVSRAIAKHMPDTRPMDNMALNLEAAFEDEYALCSTTLLSPYLSFVFPRRRAYYDRYLSLRDLPEKEVQNWKLGFLFFLKKLTFRYQRPLILKSPTHTCRIRLLLDLFPDAKFVHIHRHPFDVFRSTRHQVDVALQWYCLQHLDNGETDDWIIQRHRGMYDAFFEERSLIPTGQFHEVGFEDLEVNPMSTMRGIYEALDLPAFEHVEPRLQDYIDSLSEYRKNVFPGLSPNLQQRLYREWKPYFDEWNYVPPSD